MKFCIFLALMLLSSCFVISKEIPYSQTPVQTDANLFDNYVRIGPDDKKAETLKTKTWLWYDDDAIYAKFEAEIDSTFTDGLYAPRDSGSDCDYLRVQLITIPEAYYAYYYLFYPTASLYDGIRKDGAGLDKNWNSEYSYESSLGNNIWTVTIRLPFKDMRYVAKPPYNWKIILTRYHKKTDESFSQPYVVNKMGKEYFSKALDIRLTHQINRNSGWKFRPYFVKSYDLLTKEDTFDPEHVGMDISYSLSTKTKLKIALNPDFSDVPPDNASNYYNSKYPPRFMENRFFFTEDIDAFGVDYNFFYTRHIAQPQIAAKFTGNSDTWNYGYLCARDKKIVDDYGNIINNDDFFQIASVIKTLPNFKGAVSTASRMNSGYYNHVGTAYWDWEFVKKLHIGTSHIYSMKYSEDNPMLQDEDKLGMMNKIELKANPENWTLTTSYSNIQSDLRVDMGTYYDTGYEDYLFEACRTSDEKEQYLKNWIIYSSMAYSNKLDEHHSFSYASVYGSLSLNFLPKYSISLDIQRNREAYAGKEHDQWGTIGSFSWNKWDNLTFSLDAETGKAIIYDINLTKNYFAPSFYIRSSLGKKLSGSFNITHCQYDYQKLYTIITQLDTTIVSLDNSYQIVNANLDYNFSNKVTLRNGLNITTNDETGIYSILTFYSNFRFELKKDWFLYLGYKTGQSQDKPIAQNDWLGHFNRKSAGAYLKLSLTI
jgi:hypothetical protein